MIGISMRMRMRRSGCSGRGSGCSAGRDVQRVRRVSLNRDSCASVLVVVDLWLNMS